MVSVSVLSQAARPKTLIASVSPILIGSAIAFPSGTFKVWVFLFTLLTGLGIQISTNYINDLFDFLKGADTKNRKGPVRVTQSGLVSISQMKKACLFLALFTCICGLSLIFRGGITIALLLAFAVVLAYAYTAGPFPLAYLGLAEIFILIFFGPVATGGTYYLQTLQWSAVPFLAGLSPGLISCSLLVINNLRDIEEDRKAKKKTLVARFGKSFGKAEYSTSLILACIIPLALFPQKLFLLPLLICLIPSSLLIILVSKVNEAKSYNPLLGKTGNLLFLYTFIFCIGYLI